MIPIEKNIIVVDENGNAYEATYPKRAKGLVKKGRARFIDENKICLLCPPENEMEDKDMSENKTKSQKITIKYLLEQIEEIAKNQEHINDALQKLTFMESKGPGDVGTDGQAQAIARVVEAREETNQKLIALYEKMYDDLKPHKESTKSKAIDMLSGIVREMSFYESEQGAEILSNMLDTIRHID